METEPRKERWLLGAPNEFVAPEVIAARIWSDLERLPLPISEATYHENVKVVLAAITNGLGAAWAALGRRWPPERQERAERTVARARRWKVRKLDDATAFAENPEGGAYDMLLEQSAEFLHSDASDIDLWQELLIHQKQVYAIVALARARSRSGPVSETDRDVINALHDRLAAMMASWFESSRSNPDTWPVPPHEEGEDENDDDD